MDVKFEVQDLFEKLRPNAKVHESLVEAAEALNEIVAKQAKPFGGVPGNAAEGSDGTSEKSDDEEEQVVPGEEEEPDEEEERVDETEVLPSGPPLTFQIAGTEALEQDEEEEVVLRNRKVDPEVDEEFEREFARIMSESIESRKGASKAVFDVEPPTVRARMQPSELSVNPEQVQFAVLSRRSKQVTRSRLKVTIDENPRYSYW